MITRRGLLAAAVAVAAAPLFGCSGEKIPDNTSKDEYEIGCEALDLLDSAIKSNDLFSSDLKEKMKTLCVRARDAEDKNCSNDREIVIAVQTVAAYLALNKGDDALEAVDSLRDALGKSKE